MSLFVSHGAPTFALEPGLIGPALAQLGGRLPRPEAILVVSPHWMTSGVQVGTGASPGTLHDFNGFPPELYRLQYPAPGHPKLARRALELLAGEWRPQENSCRGLDHGAWVPLMHLFPDATVPVFQVSMPKNLNSQSAWHLGQALQPLEREGVLIIGSGSLTHNLYEVRWGDTRSAAYVETFTRWVREAVVQGDTDRLLATLDAAPHAHRAHPTPEHFLPLLVAAGAAGTGATGVAIGGGIEHGVLAMDGFVFNQREAMGLTVI